VASSSSTGDEDSRDGVGGVDQEGSDGAGDPISSPGPSARLFTLKLQMPIEWV
jgi:hypothetical protein